MPLAIKCGMSAHDFWYEDARLIECYITAYRQRSNEVAWMNGLYVYEAVSSAINNVMPGAIGRGLNGKQVKPLKYHDKPIELYEKLKNNKSETENYVFNDWVHKFRRLKGGSD